MDSEILPWSPKFHASLALGNFHYSFTPNDLFNLRTLDKRKYHKKYTYIRIRILDFFPLDTWVNLISDFYEQNLHMILKYIGDIMIQDELWKKNPECETEEDRKQTIYSNQHSKLPKTSTLKEPLLSKMKTDEAQSIKTISSNH
jgi:hypothetical protein